MTRGSVRQVVALAVLVVVVLAAAGGGAHAHAAKAAAPRIDAAPGVLGASLGDALAPGSGAGAGAMFAMEGSDLMLVEESAMIPAMFKNAHDVFGVAVSVSVPVLNPRVAVRVSVDGKAFKIAEKIKVLGSLTVAIEVDVFGLFSMHAGVTGSAVLNSKTHESVFEMLEDLGRHMLRLHERDVQNEVVRLLDEVDKALVTGEKAGAALVDTAWGELREYYGTIADDSAHWRETLSTHKGLRGAVELFDIDTLSDGEWWSAPMQYRTKVGVLVAAPFLRPAGEVGAALERVFEANGLNETMYDRILHGLGDEGAGSDDVGAGTLGIFVLDTSMSREGQRADKVKAYVQFESDIAKVETRVVEGQPPSYFQDVALPIGNRNTLPHVKVQLREPGMVMDSTLAEMKLDTSLFTDPNKVVPITLRGKADDDTSVRVDVVARWLPYRKNDALSHIGLPDDKGVMQAETGDGGAGKALQLQRVPGADGKPRWEYSRWLASMKPCSSVEEQSRVGALFGKTVELGLRPAELLLCHYLARANPDVPTNDEHVGVLLQDLVINHIDHLFEAVQPHVDPLVQAMTKVMVELHAAGQAVTSRTTRARARAAAADAMRALEKALRAKTTTKNKAAFVKASTDIMKKHVQRLRQELHVASQKLRVEKLAAFPRNGLAREMQVDFAYFFQLGGRITSGDLTVKAAAGLAGKGLRGTIKPDEFDAKFSPYELTLGGVQATFDSEWRLSLTAMHRTFHDKTQSVVLGIELQAPGDAVAEDTFRIRRLPTEVGPSSSVFEKLDAVVRVCELAAAGTEVVTGGDAIGRVLEEVEGIAFDTLFDAVVDATRKKVASFVEDKVATGGVKRGVMPGVVMRLFLSADKKGKWSHNPRTSHAFLYLMDKAEVSLAKALGPVGDAAGKLASLKVSGAMESGLWWSFGGDKGGQAPHAMETLFHGV